MPGTPYPDQRQAHFDDAGRAPAPAPAAPVTAIAGACAVAASTLCGIGAVAMISAGGREFLRDAVVKKFPSLAGGTGGEFLNAALDQAQSTLSARAGFAAFATVVSLVLALLAWRGRNWARITLIPFVLIATLVWLRDIADVGPGALHAADAVGILSGLLGVVLFFLPATGGYMKARKAARRG